MAFAALTSACRSNTSGGGVGAAPQFEAGLLALNATGAARKGEAKLEVRSGKGASHLNVIIAQVEYDRARLSLKSCDIAPALGADAAAGKQLLFLEQDPGKVRVVLTGSAEALPADAPIFACSFGIAADAAVGDTKVRIEADISDTEFTDHAFKDEVAIAVRE
jgi:hypothetical protein